MDFKLGIEFESSDATETPRFDGRGGEREDELDATGHAPASGHRGQHRGGGGNRIVALGEDALRTAAEAVGHEVALVVVGIIGGIDKRANQSVSRTLEASSFEIDEIELKFGVKTVLGTGKAIEALVTASGEATVEVTLTLSRKRFAGPSG